MEQSYRILIVEDDEPIAELVSMNFSVAGCACDTAADGFRAAELARTVPYDLAILNVMLPGLDGFELFDVMRARDIPVIYLSAKCDTPSKVRGLRMGAEDYVTKPFDVLELLVRAEKVLARRGKTDGSVSLGNVRVSEEERTALLDGAPVELKPKEFALLVLLMRHPNMVFSREQLLREVWGETYLGETRTVDSHIASLRRKLHWADRIVTVHRVGYKLTDERSAP